MKTYDGNSTVETVELKRSGKEYRYAPTEKIRIIEVDNFPVLGKLTAFRFIEWVLKNPGGVISLPTGKTPEFFIKWVNRSFDKGAKHGTQSMLNDFVIEGSRPPNMKCDSFVQNEEYYPMDSQQHGSFNCYVRESSIER